MLGSLALCLLGADGVNGFKVRRDLSAGCGQKVMLTHIDTAVLNSPRYPGSFIEQNQCLWEVRSFDPQARLKIVFDDWAMPISPSKDCVANYLEIQEHQAFGVSQSVKLCGRNPGFYVSNNDKITIVLRSSAQIQGDKSFSLRVGLTHESPRTFAQDGSFVVDGESPIPRATPPPMLPQPIPQQPVQQVPQRPFASQPVGINLFAQPPPALAPRGIEMKSAGAPPVQQFQPPQQPQQVQPGFAPPGQAPPNYYGAYGGAPAVYQQPIDGYSYYYDDYYGDSEQVSAGNKAVTVLFTITVVLCFLAVGFYFYQESQKKNDQQESEENPGDPPRKATLRGHLKNLDEFKKQLAEQMVDRTAGVREQIKTKTLKANEKLKVKAAEVKTRLSRRASKMGDDSLPPQTPAQESPEK